MWTRTQLENRLVAAYGKARGGRHVNSVRAGQNLRVSERTVRRWLAGEPDDVVGMKPASRARLQLETRPSEQKRRQEELDREYALEALAELRLPKRRQRIPQAWRDEGWIAPHMVAVLDKPYINARQITALRIDHRNVLRMHRRGQVLSFTEVPTRFHATVLVNAVFDLVDVWRVRVPPSFLKYGQGENYCWTVDAPEVDLGPIAVTNGLR